MTHDQILHLVEQAKDGDREAEGQLWQAAGEKLARTTLKKLPPYITRNQVEDLVQEGYFGFRYAIQTYDTTSKHRFPSWACRQIYYVQCRYAWTRGQEIRPPRRVKQTVAPLSLDAPLVEGEKSTGYDVLQDVRWGGTHPDALAIWKDIYKYCSYKQRQVLWAQYKRGMSNEEVTKKFGYNSHHVIKWAKKNIVQQRVSPANTRKARLIKKAGWKSAKELCEFTGFHSNKLNRLIKEGWEPPRKESKCS